MVDLLLSLIGAYAFICFCGFLLHRYFVYMPDRRRFTPAEAGLSGVQEITIRTRDGVNLIAWYAQAKRNKPTLLYFTGNGGCAATRAQKIARIQACGYGVFILNYRRYGGSGGWPTERNNIADAVAAYDRLLSLGVAREDIVAYGESLGTSVATRLSLQRPVQALVLEAPFTSVVDVGMLSWGFLPLRYIMVDQYRTIDHIAEVRVPLLVVHGARDRVIPVGQARHLYTKARNPKRLVILPRGDHNDLYDRGAWEKIDAYLAELGDAHLPVFEEVPVPAKPHHRHPQHYDVPVQAALEG
ncbi:MAG: alpha/beta hydrolase [Methyloceanibacter sp.]